MICKFVILFFCILIFNSLVSVFTKPTIIEGATGSQEYQSYGDDPLILAKKNAANIEVLKSKLDGISNFGTKVSSNQDNIKKNSDVIDSLLKSMSPTDNKASQKNQAYVDKNPKTFNM
jgi:hypothetical protein